MSEHDEQCAFFSILELKARKHPELMQAFAVPNGGLRNIRVAMKLKKEGVKAGVPDIFLPVPRGTFHGLFIEMKVKPNKPSAKQKVWIEALRKQNYFVKVCYSCQEAITVTENYLNYGSNNNTSTSF